MADAETQTRYNKEVKIEAITSAAALCFQIIYHVVYMCSIFKTNGVGEFNGTYVLDQYSTDMTPALWGNNVWQFLLALQYAWTCGMVYYFLVCKDDEKLAKRLLWSKILFCIGSFFNTLRVVLLGYAQLTASFFMSLVAAITLVPSSQLLTSLPLPSNLPNDECDKWFIKAFYYTGNGASSGLAGWTFFYMLVHLAMTLTYESPIEATAESAGTACLSIFLVAYCLIMLLHLWPLERFNRHHHAPQIIAIAAITCIFVNLDEDSTNGRFSLSILVITTLGLIAKIFMGILFDRMERDISPDTLPIIPTN